MSNQSLGEVDVDFGDHVKKLSFKTAEIMMLEERLGAEVFHYLATSKSPLRFCVEAVYAGLSRTAEAKKLTIQRISDWFDKLPKDRSVTEIQKDILYAIARGKPGEEGIELVKALDEQFAKETPGVPPPSSPG